MIQIHSNFQLRPQVFPKNIHPHDLQRQRHLRPQQQLVQVVHAHGARGRGAHGALRGGSGAAEEFRGGVALQQAPEGILCGDGLAVRFPSG